MERLSGKFWFYCQFVGGGSSLVVAMGPDVVGQFFVVGVEGSPGSFEEDVSGS